MFVMRVLTGVEMVLARAMQEILIQNIAKYGKKLETEVTLKVFGVSQSLTVAHSVIFSNI